MLHSFLTFIDRWSWLALLLAAPVFWFPSPERVWVWFIVPLMWIVAALAGRGALPRTPLNLSLLLLAVMVLVSLFVTWSVPVSLPKVGGLVLGLGAFFAVARTGKGNLGFEISDCGFDGRRSAIGARRAGQSQIRNPKSAIPNPKSQMPFALFVGAGLGVAVLGLFGAQWGAKFQVLAPITAQLMRMARVKGLPGAAAGLNPNEVAGALLWVAPVCLALAVWLPGRGEILTRRRGAIRLVLALLAAWIVTLFVFSVLVLTQSRGAYFGLAVACLGMALAALSLRGRLLLSILAALVLTVALLAVGPAGPGGLWDRLNGTKTGVSASRALSSWEGRVELWSRGLAGLRDFPLTGLGLNGFRGQIHARYPSAMFAPTSDVAHAHNEFLQAGLDLGLPGMIAFVALYIGAFAMLRRVWRAAARGAVERALALGLGGGLLAHAVYGLTDAVALGAKPGILFWLLLGLIAGLHARLQSRMAEMCE